MEMQKMQAENQMKMLELKAEMQLENVRLQAQHEAELARLEAQAAIDSAKVSAQKQIEQMKAQIPVSYTHLPKVRMYLAPENYLVMPDGVPNGRRRNGGERNSK